MLRVALPEPLSSAAKSLRFLLYSEGWLPIGQMEGGRETESANCALRAEPQRGASLEEGLTETADSPGGVKIKPFMTLQCQWGLSVGGNLGQVWKSKSKKREGLSWNPRD